MSGVKKFSPVPIHEPMVNEDNKGTVPFIRFLEELRKKIALASGGAIGSVFDFAGEEANLPDGAMACNGQELSTEEYPDLFAAIGYLWGGSGNTFNLPNQERDSVGAFKRGVSPSGAVGDFIDDDVGEHQHTISHTHSIEHDHPNVTSSSKTMYPFQQINWWTGGGAQYGSDLYVPNYSTGTKNGSSQSHTHTVNVPNYSGDSGDASTTDSGLTGGTETRPKAFVFLWAIWVGTKVEVT